MQDDQKTTFPKKDRSKKQKKTKNFNSDKLKQKEMRLSKHDRKNKITSLRLDELADFDDDNDFNDDDDFDYNDEDEESDR